MQINTPTLSAIAISGSYNDLSNKPTLSSFGITATAAELNKLDGVTATTAELNYVDGVTSNIQEQLNGKAPYVILTQAEYEDELKAKSKPEPAS